MTHHTTPQKQEPTKAAIAPSSNPLSPRPFAEPADAREAAPELQLVDSSLAQLSTFAPDNGSSPPIQRKLTIGAPNDPYEQEADRVAKQVVQHLHAPSPGLPLQRASLSIAHTIHRAANQTAVAGEASQELETSIHRARGRGHPLAPVLQQQMGQAMGADFSNVKVHTDSESDQLNQSIQAKAFTTGQDVFFRQGAYQPGSRGGQELIAHELTHVVQQDGSAVQRRAIGPISSNLATAQQPVVKGATVASLTPTKTVQRNHDHVQLNEVEAQKNKVSTFKNLYNGTLAGLAAALNAVPVAEGLLSDEFLLRILKEAFEENWFKAKACLTTDQWPSVKTYPDHAISIELMKAMVNMRGRMWDKFVKKVQPQIIGEVMRVRNISDKFTDINNPKSNLRENFGLKDAVGSESVTSDIDLSGMGANTEIGVALINKEFPTYFGVSVEPGALFDINVYSSDWMFGGKEVRGEAGIFTVEPTSESEVLTGQSLSPKNQKKKDDQNEAWSMLKIRRNMTAVDWNIYKVSVLEGISDVAKVNNMKRQFSLVDAEYKTFHGTVQSEVEKMKKALDYEANHQKSAFSDKHGKDHLGEEAMEMAASNRQYESIILRVKALRLKIKKLQDNNAPRSKIERLLLDLHNEISRGLTYANEVYATEGAVLHTVYGKQGAVKKLAKLKGGEDTSSTMSSDEITGVKYLLSKEQYLQSVNENVGDTIHSLNHNKHDPQYAVYRAGKYIDRLCEAVRELISVEEVSRIQAYSKLLEIGNKSTEEKGGAAGKDPTAVHDSSSFFSKFSQADLGRVRAWAMDLGAKTTAIYKKTLP